MTYNISLIKYNHQDSVYLVNYSILIIKIVVHSLVNNRFSSIDCFIISNFDFLSLQSKKLFINRLLHLDLLK